MIDIFCPNCKELILEQARCPSCGWQRPLTEGDVGSQLWCADLGTRLIKPHCYPVVAAGRYCLATEDGTLIALDASSGEVLWERPLDKDHMAHAVASDGERMYVGCEDIQTIPKPGKALWALDLASGETVWEFPTEARSLSAAAVSGGTVYFSSSEETLCAVDAETGGQRWAVPHPLWGPAPPAVGGGVVCAGGRDQVLAAYDASSGRELWRYTGCAWFAERPAISQGRAYTRCWDGQAYAFDLRSGRLIWQARGERGKGFTCPVAADDERVYIGSRVNRQVGDELQNAYAMLGLDASNGAELWRFITDKHVEAPPEVVESTLFFGANDGTFYALSADRGEERWRIKVTSRAVTWPQVWGDVVIWGSRDGMIYALRWRASPEVKVLAPSTYKRRQEYDNAAASHALRGEFLEAAAIFEKLGKMREAAQLYERGGEAAQAGPLWEQLGEWERARAQYRQTDDKAGLARVLEALGEPLEAGRLHEEMGELGEAARLYELAGNRARAAELLVHVGQVPRAVEIWQDLGEWERETELLLKQKKWLQAAAILEQHQRLERAAELYETAGEARRALNLRSGLGHWEKVAELAAGLGDHVQEGQAWQRTGRNKLAAQAYQRAAEQLLKASTVDEERVAELYQRAANLYAEVFEDDLAAVSRREVRRYRHLPEIMVLVEAQDAFTEFQWNTLNLQVKNGGYGIARAINIDLRGPFEVEGDASIPGLPPDREAALQIFARPHKEQYGPRVPLEVIVSYSDMSGEPYEFNQLVPVAVVQRGILSRATPLEIRIEGDILESGAQKGDKVVIDRRGQRGLVVQDETQCAPVQVRQVDASVRRCPVCNLPIKDPHHRHCPDCGAPLAMDDQDG